MSHARLLEQETLAAIGRMASAVSHEIRNPLSSIRMNMQILAERVELEPREHRHLTIAIEEMDRLNRVVTDLLHFAKPLELAYELVDLDELVEAALEVVAPGIEERGIEIHRAYAETSPASPSIPRR